MRKGTHVQWLRGDRVHPDTVATWRIACLLTLGAFVGLGVTAFATGLLPGDLDLRHVFREQNSPFVYQLARVVNEAGTWRVLLPASILLYVLSPAARRHWWLWGAVLVGSSLIENSLKILIGRPRPSGFSFGFPSGHSTAAATFAVILVYLVGTRASLPSSTTRHPGDGARGDGARGLGAHRAGRPLAHGRSGRIPPGRRLRRRRGVVGKRSPGRRRPPHVTRAARAILLAALSAALGLSACDKSPQSTAEPLIVTSFYPLYEFSRRVAGPSARVVSLVPAGAEPHDWEPSPQDLALIKKARLLVWNGGGLDPWVSKLVADHAPEKTLVVKATEGIPLLVSPGSSDGGRDRPIPDPHVWLDPVLAQSMVETIRAALARADPAHASTYDANTRVFVAELQALHEKFKAGLAHCARRDVVTSHAAFAYLAKRYDLTIVPVMGLTPEAEPSPAQLAAIVRFARDRKVKYIFFETLVSPRLAETLAREIGAQTLVFNPIEGLTKEEHAAGRGYVALMEENLKNLRVALDCR